MKACSLSLAALFLAGLSCTGVSQDPAEPPRREPPPVRTDASLARDLRVEVKCSETDLRTVIALLSWRAGEGEASALEVELTVFKDGFERGLFASAPAVRKAEFVPSPALRELNRPPGRPFALTAEPRYQPQTRHWTVEIKPLEPAILYHFRIAQRAPGAKAVSQVVTIDAPVCVADEREGR